MEIDWSKPDYLYRVTCSCCSQALTVEGEGIVARSLDDVDLFARYKEKKLAKLQRCFENHMDWSCREPSPFMSAYGDKETATTRAANRADDGHTDVAVTMIDASCLGKGTVRHVDNVRKQFGIRLRPEVYYGSQYEYLILHRVPEAAILVVEHVGP
ncbi:hypothetical protein JDV02_010413 [Purpureocillium takamizusanense]|uniref:DUF7587 domain-containing protein n=1 Tax=Purpureocillium takamizusanense TaxID=2060973 RepID=A0A9Q8QS72_9HYPO|nr:uncharacterized protein JDV02_010413 [Purpureocillium takamizusanense]UNI24683.1 hypothetical protein JDV02_010413 [Purpureocillium takamizusanense]